MQQAIYNNSTNGARNTTLTMTTAAPAARPKGLTRWAAARWEMVGVLALMGSSAAYGVFALAHLGL